MTLKNMKNHFEGLSDDSNWYRLDNAATGFGIITNKRYSEVYRIAATLKEPVQLTVLQNAIAHVLTRFPYFRVNLKTGFFWHFWETNLKQPEITKENRYPNQYFKITSKGRFLFNVKAYFSRLALEIHHSLTDGTGALIFFKALLCEYLYLTGMVVTDWEGVARPAQLPLTEELLNNEYEDSYKKFSHKIRPVTMPHPSKVFHLPFKRVKKGHYYVTTGILPMNEVIAKAKASGVSLTEFIIAVYIDALQKIQQLLQENKKKRPIRIVVPTNLRNMFPSRTMRNFFLCVTPEINPGLGEYDFQEITKQVHHQMREKNNKKYLNQLMYRNVQNQWHPVNRAVPLFLKKVIVKHVHKGNEKRLYSGMLSNLGRVELPEAIGSQIGQIQFVPTPAVSKVSIGMVSFGDQLSITFGRIIKEPYVEKYFFRKLTELGFSVKIETNY
jgi:NRPS condensation-like uncharacterized protein